MPTPPNSTPPTAKLPPGYRIRAWLVAAWAVFVTLMYLHRQLSQYWPAIREQVIGPLLGAPR